MLEAQTQLPSCPANARLISLTQGKFAIVDEEDFGRLSKQKWYCSKGYAARMNTGSRQPRGLIYMHHEVLPIKVGFEVDHRNSLAVLDNRKSNLRYATHQQNMCNTRIRKDNVSGFKGVWWSARRKRFQTQIAVFGKRYSLGAYEHLEEAAGIRLTAALEYHGEFAVVEDFS